MNDLRTRQIRFSQPAALNDVHEGTPEVAEAFAVDFVNEDIIPILQQIPFESWLTTYLIQAYERLSDLEKRSMSPQQYLAYRFAVLRPHLAAFKSLWQEQIDERSRRASEMAAPLAEIMATNINQNYGVLSLSESPTVELLWGHYADGDRGFLIGLDSENDFFKPDGQWGLTTNPLQKVQYRNMKQALEERHNESNDQSLFFSKPESWSYEKEWRLLRRLSSATQVIEGQPYRIHLYTIPPDAVTTVVLGARSSAELETDIREVLNDPELAHVTLQRVHLSGYDRSLVPA
jgi:hypothetical protein